MMPDMMREGVGLKKKIGRRRLEVEVGGGDWMWVLDRDLDIDFNMKRIVC